MTIQFTCSCGRKLQAQEEHAGRRVKCPVCGTETTVPGAEDAVQPREAVEPKASPVKAAASRRPAEEDEDDNRPRRRSRTRDDEEDEDDRPRRRSRARDDDEDEDEDDRPRRRSRVRDEEEDEDEDERPRRRAPAGTSGKATAALVLGLLSFCLNVFTGIPAIILALLSFGDIRRSRGRRGGKGLAIAGLILGCLGTLLSSAGYYFAFTGVGEATQRMQVQNDMMQMSLAMHNYHDTYGRLPAAKPDAKTQPPTKLSWRVQLLPYLENDNLWRQFRQDEPWDSPHNKALLTRMPAVFAHPRHPEATAQGLTYFRVFTGERTVFPPGRGLRIAEIADGTANTLLIVEAADPVPWTKPDELEYDPGMPLPKLGGHFRGGFVAALADGEVRVIGPSVSERTLRLAIDPRDGNVLGPDWR